MMAFQRKNTQKSMFKKKLKIMCKNHSAHNKNEHDHDDGKPNFNLIGNNYAENKDLKIQMTPIDEVRENKLHISSSKSSRLSKKSIFNERANSPQINKHF